jgi:hypothetical protein
MRLLRALEHNPGFRKSFRRRSGGGAEEDKIKGILELQRSRFLEDKPDVLLFTIKLQNGEEIQELGRLDIMRFEFQDTTEDGYVVKLYDVNGDIRRSINMLNEDSYNNNISRTWNDGEIFLWKNITASVPSDDHNIVPKQRSEYLKHYYNNMYRESDVSHQHKWGQTKTYCTNNEFKVLHHSHSSKCFSLNTKTVQCYGPDIYKKGADLSYRLYKKGQKTPNSFQNCIN